MATSTLVYISPSSTLRISQTPLIVDVREPGSRTVRLRGIITYQRTTGTSSTIIWIRRPLKYIVVASETNRAAGALWVAAAL